MNFDEMAEADLTPEVYEKMVTMARRYKKQAAQADERYRVLQARLIDHLGTASEGKDKRFTVVAGEKAVIDEDSLRKRVGSSMWNKITTRKLDKKKLEAQIAANEIDMKEVAAVSSMKPITAYIRWK